MTKKQIDAIRAAHIVLGLIWVRAKETGFLSRNEIDLLCVAQTELDKLLRDEGLIKSTKRTPQNWPNTKDEKWKAMK